MAIMRSKDIRKMGRKELNKRLAELKLELVKERASIYVGASVTSPGKIKEIKRTIARANTIMHEQARSKKPVPAKAARPAAKPVEKTAKS